MLVELLMGATVFGADAAGGSAGRQHGSDVFRVGFGLTGQRSAGG